MSQAECIGVKNQRSDSKSWKSTNLIQYSNKVFVVGYMHGGNCKLHLLSYTHQWCRLPRQNLVETQASSSLKLCQFFAGGAMSDPQMHAAFVKKIY